MQVQPLDPNWLTDPATHHTQIEATTKALLSALVANGVGTIAITDHNSGYAIDVALKVVADEDLDLVVIPGVEIETAEGWHCIVIFDPEYKDELGCNTWHETVREFIRTHGGVEGAIFNEDGTARQVTTGTKKLIKKVTKNKIGVFLFSHCDTGGKDFFSRGNSTSRKEILENHPDVIFDSKLGSAHQIEQKIQNILNEATYELDYPVVSTSDAHSPKELGRFTWIKADRGFEGLKQILFEPHQRVRLQDENPNTDFSKYVLDEIAIESSSAGLKSPQIIPLNRDFVSLVGGKGSGKSLMLKMLSALMSGYTPHPAIKDKKTLTSYRLLDKDMNGVKVSSLDISTETDQDEPILYVEQEELANKSKSKKSVRNAYLRELGILDTSLDYKELDLAIERLIDDIHDQVESINELQEQTGFLKVKGKDTSFSEFLEAKVTSLKKTIEKTSSHKTKKLISDISEVMKQGRAYGLWQKESGFSDIENELIKLSGKVEDYNIRAKELGLESKLTEIKTTDLEREHRSVEKEVSEKLEASRKEYLRIKGELEALDIKEDIPVLLKTLEGIQNELHQFEEAQKNYKSFKQTIQNRKDELSQLFADGKDISKAIQKSIAEIDKKYKEFCADKQDSTIFKKLFGEIEIKADVFFDYKQLLREMSECFYKDTVQDLEQEIFGTKEKTYTQYFEWVSTKFWNYYDTALNQKKFKVQIVGSSMSGDEKLLDVVFSKWFEVINVSTSIINKFGDVDKEIAQMSTGELATVLLKLKLVTEGLNKQIILLDQPEDHLDNNFIASGLVDLLKAIKLERQIIVATHNANLVVGADSEQVIIANGIENSYSFGSLENEDIRNSIIHILEGGREAFRKRSNKLRLGD